MRNGAPDGIVEAPFLGADNRIRTGDPHLGKVMLYQLSYVRTGDPWIPRGRYWDRTSDLFRVKEARYRCANRPRCARSEADSKKPTRFSVRFTPDPV